MKKILLSFLLMFLPMLANSEIVEIDGIRYKLSPQTKEATVISPLDEDEYTGNLVIPASVTYNDIKYSVTSIGRAAFAYDKRLFSVTIPNSVTSIGIDAFCGCSRLTSVTMSNSVTSIPYGAFAECSNLSSITIPNSVTKIGSYAFGWCSALSSITIPNSVISIDRKAFYLTAWYDNQPDGLLYLDNCLIGYKGNEPIGNLRIKEGTRLLAKSAFVSCQSLTSVTIPNSMTSISSRVFYNCNNLTSITIPNSVTSIEEGAFDNTAWYNNQPDGVVYVGKVAYNYKGEMPANTKIIIKDGTLGIANYAFADDNGVYYHYNLISVVIPGSVTSIGDYAFRSCENLSSVTIHNGVKIIGNWMFMCCKSLASITIPNSVTSIGCYAFYWCDNMKDIYCLAKNLSTDINGNYEGLYTFPNAFSDYIVNSTLHVPAGSIDEYRSVEPWSRFGKIVALTNDDPISTGILRASNPMNDSDIYYDLNGRKVVPYKGIYIHNGKKILKK